MLFDGAIGTYYKSLNRPYDIKNANNLDYDTIVEIHKQYISAGANCITTNSYKIEDLNNLKLGYKAALDAVEDKNIKIFISIGPIEKYEIDDYIQILDLYINLGASNFIFETFSDINIILKLSKYLKSKIDCFIIASLAIDANGYSNTGKYYLDLFKELKKSNLIDVYGLNCICGPKHMLKLASNLPKDDKLSFIPNAGYSSVVNDTIVYSDNVEYFAENLVKFINIGANYIGGCCGTTPKHIKAVFDLLQNNKKIDYKPEIDTNNFIPQQKNDFIKKLKNKNGKLFIVEYDPPSGATGQSIDNEILQLSNAKVDGITVADNPLGKARADSFIVASRIKRLNKDLTVIPHLTCRDRNSLSIHSSIIGLSIEEIYNVLCITGDPIAQKEYQKGVFSFNSITLMDYVKSINKQNFNNNFAFGGALNLNANKFNLELERAKKKIKSGAKFLITQPCFNNRSIENLKIASKELDIPIIAGLMPIKSYKNALFLNNEVSGIDIPENIINEFKDKSVDETFEITINICYNLANDIKDYVKGFHILNLPNATHITTNLIKRLKENL